MGDGAGVWIAVRAELLRPGFSGAESIRDVIAFPKSGGGYDPLTQAPAPITPQQRKEAGVDSKPLSKDEPKPAQAESAAATEVP